MAHASKAHLDEPLCGPSGRDPRVLPVASAIDHTQFDHVLFSFHGLPQRQILKGDVNGICLSTGNCCSLPTPHNQHCYSAQCHSMAHKLAESLKLPPERYSIAFQSRLGKDPWLQPYTGETLSQLAKQGIKRVLLFSPSFVCDCLETTYEIGVEYSAEFKKAGGVQLQLVPGLNSHPAWLDAMHTLLLEHL